VVVALQIQLSQYGDSSRGATTAEKLRGTKVWVPTPGRVRPKAGLDVVRVREYHPGKFFEYSDATSCILVPTIILCLLVGSLGHCWSPDLKVGGPVSPDPYHCCAYGQQYKTEVGEDWRLVVRGVVYAPLSASRHKSR